VPDDLAALLAGIKKRHEAAAELNLDLIAELKGPDTRTVGGWIAASALDVPLLLAAIDAVLKEADSAQVVCEEETFPPQPVAWDLDPVKVREAITTALAGKEGGDGRRYP
jgi:hypothetical protein